MDVPHWLRSLPIWWLITMLSSVVPDMALWQQVGKAYCWHPTGWTVTAFPHRRRTVLYTAVADAIRDEVVFLPSARAADLLFNDHTPFVSEKTKQWLATQPGNQASASHTGE